MVTKQGELRAAPPFSTASLEMLVPSPSILPPQPSPMGHIAMEENQLSFFAPHNLTFCQGEWVQGHGSGTAAHLSHIIWSWLEGDRAGQVGGNLGRTGKERKK